MKKLALGKAIHVLLLTGVVFAVNAAAPLVLAGKGGACMQIPPCWDCSCDKDCACVCIQIC